MEFAIEAKDTNAAKLLLSDPAVSVNSRNQFWYTPLMVAAENKRIDIVKLLLARPDINIEIKNKHDQTALDIATCPEIIKLLQSHQLIDNISKKIMKVNREDILLRLLVSYEEAIKHIEELKPVPLVDSREIVKQLISIVGKKTRHEKAMALEQLETRLAQNNTESQTTPGEIIQEWWYNEDVQQTLCTHPKPFGHGLNIWNLPANTNKDLYYIFAWLVTHYDKPQGVFNYTL